MDFKKDKKVAVSQILSCYYQRRDAGQLENKNIKTIKMFYKNEG